MPEDAQKICIEFYDAQDSTSFEQNDDPDRSSLNMTGQDSQYDDDKV